MSHYQVEICFADRNIWKYQASYDTLQEAIDFACSFVEFQAALNKTYKARVVGFLNTPYQGKIYTMIV